MADRLGLYNGALRMLGSRALASLSENREPRRLLDAAWGDWDAIDFCLEQGSWTFATRAQELPFNPSIEPAFGYSRGYKKPADFVRTIAICSDEYFNCPITRFSDESGYWFTDDPTIYVKYTSNADDKGHNLSAYPQTFVNLVEAYLAKEIGASLTQSDSKVQKAEADYFKALSDARGADAMNVPTTFMPPGSWSRSRRGSFMGWGSRRDRGY